MRCEERKFSGHITGGYEWVPMVRPFGSNIRGIRIKKGSVFISPEELMQFLEAHNKEQLVRYLNIIDICYTPDETSCNS